MEAPDNAACSQEMYIIMTANINAMCFRYSILSYTATRQWCSSVGMVTQTRDQHSKLRTQIDTLISVMAGYLEFSMIPPCIELDQVRISIMFTCEKHAAS